jgi:hypothetical protein
MKKIFYDLKTQMKIADLQIMFYDNIVPLKEMFYSGEIDRDQFAKRVRVLQREYKELSGKEN